jgi:amidohydrolase
MDISNLIEKYTEEFTSVRREFHMIPELGFKEFKTTEGIVKYLEHLDIKVKTFNDLTGAVGMLEVNEKYKTIGIRADIDGLPIYEKTGLEYTSKNNGMMHACGHDGHIAIALGTAKILTMLKDTLKVNVKFIFQPAEETTQGAEKIIENHALENPKLDAIFGLHIIPGMESGSIGLKEGPIMAAADKFEITIKGKGGHGAMPHKTIDPIVIAGDIISSFQKVISREVDPLDSAVISIGIINAGTAFNIIPEEVHMAGTVRTFDPYNREHIKNRINEFLEGITRGYGGSYSLKYTYGIPAVRNDSKITKKIKKILEHSIGQEAVVEAQPTMGSEDFALFLQQVPGSFIFLGSNNQNEGVVNSLHHPEYTIDEKVISVGVRAFCEIILNY